MAIPLIARIATSALPAAGKFLAPALPYLMVGAVVAAFGGGYALRDRFAKAELVDAVQNARENEQLVSKLALDTERAARDAADTRKREADEKLTTLQKRLAAAPRCDVPVPPEWVRSRPTALPATPRSSPGIGPPSAHVDTAARERDRDEPVADARAVVANCERNRLEVFDAEVSERQQLREFYKRLVKQYNGRL